MSARRTALIVSPHLDDAAFSCGGTVAAMAHSGWHTIIATVFTRSVMGAGGFALACQTDKGIPPDADYMALRRQEDLDAAALLGCAALHWMDLPEAPHRGYDSAPALFGAVLPNDGVQSEVEAALRDLDAAHRPLAVLVPQGLGNHVDHQIVVRAALAVFSPGRLTFYRDTPYALRHPHATPLPGVPAQHVSRVDIAAWLEARIAASAAYASQIGFQFGGAAPLAEALRAFALAEGAGRYAETFCGATIDISAGP